MTDKPHTGTTHQRRDLVERIEILEAEIQRLRKPGAKPFDEGREYGENNGPLPSPDGGLV